MNNKLNLETVINTLSLIHSNEKWSIDNLCKHLMVNEKELFYCLLYTSPSPRDLMRSRMPSSA